MDIKYNGITLQIVWTNQVRREAQHSEDGVDYLWTHWLFDVEAILNVQATSFDSNINPRGGIPGPVTDANIRHTMMQPQKQLAVICGQNSTGNPFTLLQTPDPGFTSDAHNGPRPLRFDILDVGADKTLRVHFVIEAWVNECDEGDPDSDDDRPVILSHRWRQIVDVDEDHFAARRTIGTVVLRTDELYKQNITADQFRQFIAHPVPGRMKRDGIQVVAESDNSTLHYTFLERDTAFNLRAGNGATRLEVYHTKITTQESVFGNPGVNMNTVFGVVAGAMQLGQTMFNTVTNGAFQNFTFSDAEITSALQTATAKYHEHIFCRAWGNVSSSRNALRNLAFAVVAGRMSLAFPNGLADAILAPTRKITCTDDCMGKFVEVDCTYQIGGVAQAIGFGIMGAIPFPADDLLRPPAGAVGPAIPALITDDTNSPVSTNPPMPRDLGARGTNPVALLTQALTGPCTDPAVVPQPEYIV